MTANSGWESKLGKWEFDKVFPSSVRLEVTQRDQFNNDEVLLAEALVREAIQNSSDAQSGDNPAKVRFAVKSLSGNVAKEYAASLASLASHLNTCGVDQSALDLDVIRALVVEDFNTSGLTGSFEEIDKGNFDRFWRAVGDSGKGGKSGGRWGLGKLVYSSASKLKLFYGLSVTQVHLHPFLMGQITLKSHRIGDDFYPPHGFFFEGRSSALKLQLPIEDTAEIASFKQKFGVSRVSQPGLSVVIPYLEESVDEDSITTAVLQNYYFPILSGRLVVEVGNLTIDKSTFFEIAKSKSHLADIPFGFVANVSKRLDKAENLIVAAQIGDDTLSSSCFSAEQLDQMKKDFSEGNIIHVKVPIGLKRKDGTNEISSVNLFLQPLPDGKKSFSLFARGPITLPGERRYFGGAAAYGALIATDDGMATFLGDAENPAHTRWDLNAEKVTANWRSPQAALYQVRHSLRALFDLVSDELIKEDRDALNDFFSILEKSKGEKTRRKKPEREKIDIPPPREKGISIKPRTGGFDLVAGPASQNWAYPRAIRIRVAYDMIGANPFQRHSPFDFDFSKGHDISMESTAATYEALSANVIRLIATQPDFAFKVRGFDVRRDIVVDARANP